MSVEKLHEFISFLVFVVFATLRSLVRLVIPPKLKSLKNEIILITGAASGIGKSICFELVKSGAKVVCWDMNKEENEAVVKKLRSLGVKAYDYHVDVADKHDVKAAAERVRKEVGDVTIILNNAGVLYTGEFIYSKTDDIEKVYKVNVFAHFYILKEFLPRMIEKGRGHIAATCSLSAIEGFPYGLPYASSKYAVEGYMDCLRKEMILHPNKPDIKFTTVFPYFVDSPMVNSRYDTEKFFAVGILTTDYVAKKYVEGIRRNQERVYCPPSSIYFLVLSWLIPSAIRDEVLKFINKDVVHKKTDAKISSAKINDSMNYIKKLKI